MTLESKIKGVEVEIKCTTGKFEATLKRFGNLTGTDKFENCSVPKPAGECTISEKTIKSEPIIGNLEGPIPAGPPEIKLEGSTSIAVITIEGCAAIAGKYTLKGEQKCKVDANYVKEQPEHELICEKTGSKLKLENETASLSMTAKGSLEESLNWSMQLN